MLFSTPVTATYCIVVTVLLGLCMGSFLNCLAWRTTHGESVMRGRSHCTSCSHELGARDLVPVFSWLSAKGRCRYCGAKVSARYPLTEALCALIYLSILLRYDLSLETIELLCFAGILLALSLTDLDNHTIPNGFIIAAIVVRVAYIVAAGLFAGESMLDLVLWSLPGAVVLGVGLLVITLVADHVLGRESMGGGDIKLFFVAGLYFGWQQGLLLVIIACILGIVFALIGQRAATKENTSPLKAAADMGTDSVADAVSVLDAAAGTESLRTRQIPFGPSIAAACWVIMLFGPGIIGWYMGFLA